MLTKEQILGAKDLQTRKVEVPEWGGAVYVRPLSSRDRDKYEAEISAGGQASFENIRARLGVCCICDESGTLLFTAEDAAELGKKAAGPMQKVFNVIMEVNGFTESDVDELAKN